MNWSCTYWEVLYLASSWLPDNTASVLSFYTESVVEFLPVLRMFMWLNWEKGSIGSMLHVATWVIFGHLKLMYQLVTERKEISNVGKCQVYVGMVLVTDKMRRQPCRTEVWNCAGESFKSLKCSGDGTEPVQLGSGLVFLNWKAWISLILVLSFSAMYCSLLWQNYYFSCKLLVNLCLILQIRILSFQCAVEVFVILIEFVGCNETLPWRGMIC